MAEKKKIVRIAKRIDFAAAHYLYGGSGSPHCEVVHGHNWIVEAVFEDRNIERSKYPPKMYGDIKGDLMRLVHDRWDHTTLNDDSLFGPLIPPTCENVALTIFDMLKQVDQRYVKVTVWENYPNNRAEVTLE